MLTYYFLNNFLGKNFAIQLGLSDAKILWYVSCSISAWMDNRKMILLLSLPHCQSQKLELFRSASSFENFHCFFIRKMKEKHI